MMVLEAPLVSDLMAVWVRLGLLSLLGAWLYRRGSWLWVVGRLVLLRRCVTV